MKHFANIVLLSLLLASCSSCNSAVSKARALSMPTNAPPEVCRAIATLTSSNARDRGLAARSLAEMGSRAETAVPVLILMLDDEAVCDWISSRKVQDTASYALTRIGVPASRPLAAALTNGTVVSISGRALAIGSLGRIGDKRTMACVLASLKSRSSVIRAAAADALCDFRDPATAEALSRAMLNDTAPEVRWASAAALGRIRNEDYLPQLMLALNDKHEYVRKAAASALGYMKMNLVEGDIVDYQGSPDGQTFMVTIQIVPEPVEVNRWLERIWKLNVPPAAGSSSPEPARGSNCIFQVTGGIRRTVWYDPSVRLYKYSVEKGEQ